MNKVVKSRKDRYVAKGNDLVEAKRSMHLTTRERKLVAYMVSCISPYDDDFKEYRFPIEEFIQFFSITDKNAAKEYERIAHGIMSKPFTVENDVERFTATWLSEAKYHKKQKIFTFRFTPSLKRYLIQLKKFYTRYKMINLIHMENCYSESLYELLKQYETIGKRNVSIEKLRIMLGLERKYPLYSNLRVKVLEPAVEEINKFSDITISYQEAKEGRKISSLNFEIKPDPNNEFIKEGLKKYNYLGSSEDFSNQSSDDKEQSLNQNSLPDEIPDELKGIFQRLVEEFQFEREEAHVLAVKYDVSYLEANLKLTLERVLKNRKRGINTDISRYARAAIMRNYAGDNEEISAATPAEVASAQGDRRRAIENFVERAHQAWYKKAVEKFIQAEGPTHFKGFSKYLMTQPEQALYAPVNELLLTNGLNHPQVKAYFQSWIVESERLKDRFSKAIFMTEQGYSIENEGDIKARLMRRGRLMDV
ncbi:replication initiation protein [Lentisphaera profundi]|uniref:Replication initiation protein n=1 Tax=Lentisphaera profundi TaxID=1658616 RepID=A0ABY7VRW7_9BACT|nr:replication initiation protein [Lentisphaera profundi]WDE96044.1 replication initiation protein [Lentisphaera profundi]